jgi:hypothetical protein
MRATSGLLLVAQLLALGHLAIVRHTICSEHGEAIHSGSPGEARGLRPAHEGAAADPALGQGGPPAEHSHDHCLALANTRERFALLPALDLITGPLVAAARLPSLSAVSAAPAVAVLFFAPKNSPPRA